MFNEGHEAFRNEDRCRHSTKKLVDKCRRSELNAWAWAIASPKIAERGIAQGLLSAHSPTKSLKPHPPAQSVPFLVKHGAPQYVGQTWPRSGELCLLYLAPDSLFQRLYDAGNKIPHGWVTFLALK